MNKVFALLLTGSVLLGTAHCSDDNGDTGSTGSGDQTLDCAGVCDAAAALGCPNDVKADCVAECNGDRSEQPACSAQFDAFITCAAGLLTCNSDGKAEADDKKILASCTSQAVAMESCGYCNPRTSADACEQCKAKTCCSAVEAALADPGFIPLITCIQACAPSDSACGKACAAKYPDALAKQQAVGQCEDTQCQKECEAPVPPSP